MLPRGGERQRSSGEARGGGREGGGAERRVDEDEGGSRGACEALEELVEELVEEQRPVDCGQDVVEEQARLQDEMHCQPGA